MATKYQSGYTDGNNLYGTSTSSTAGAATVRVFNELYTRLDFTFQSSASPVFGGSVPGAALVEDGTFDPAPAGLKPVAMTLADGGSSTVDVHIYNYASLITTLNYPNATIADPGLRYSILIVGSEYRVYKDWLFGLPPLAVIPAPGTGPTFPLRGFFGAGAHIDVRNINIANGIALSTLYSRAQQDIDFSSVVQSVLNLRIYQQGQGGKPDGVPVDAIVPTFGGLIMLESGGTDNLLQEDNTAILKE